MAKKKKLTRALPVQFDEATYQRIKDIADHEKVEESMAHVVRLLVGAALVPLELELEIRTLDDLDDVELLTVGLTRDTGAVALDEQDKNRLLGKEDRSAGCFGGPPLPA